MWSVCQSNQSKGSEMNKCPNCEYHKESARMWRQEAYKFSGHPLNDEQGANMTDLRKAAEMALAKFEHLWEIGIDAEYKVELLPEIKALRQAIEQAEKQEPRKEWVGLTDAELAEFSAMKLGAYDLCLEVEAKLKEKNGG